MDELAPNTFVAENLPMIASCKKKSHYTQIMELLQN
jgi:site-specific DNA-cytosine methylase